MHSCFLARDPERPIGRMFTAKRGRRVASLLWGNDRIPKSVGAGRTEAKQKPNTMTQHHMLWVSFKYRRGQ